MLILDIEKGVPTLASLWTSAASWTWTPTCTMDLDSSLLYNYYHECVVQSIWHSQGCEEEQRSEGWRMEHLPRGPETSLFGSDFSVSTRQKSVHRWELKSKQYPSLKRNL